jgi:integrase/recombinase XerD
LPRHALTLSEVEAVLAQADLTNLCGLRDRAIMETLYSTGLRRTEALTLELADLDRERDTVLVRQGKGKKDRFVPIGRRALAWIDKYLAEVRPKFLTDARTTTLFLSSRGGPLQSNQLSALVRKYLEQAGIAKPGACHLFRHTAATLMLEGGADVRYIQAFLGHNSLATTQIYTHVSILKLREVHERTHPARLFRTPGAPATSAPPSASDPLADNLDDEDGDALWVPVA